MMLRNRLLVTVIMIFAVVGVVEANLPLVTDRLALDAMVRAGAHWLRAEQYGLAQSDLAFEKVGAFAGVTWYLSPVVSFRVSCDVGAFQPQDLYVDLLWRSGLRLRAGQFLLPLGIDAMTKPDSQALAGRSFLVSFAKPSDTRDIGVMGSWSTSRFSASAAVVNGRGPNANDNNARKDLCGRISVKPFATLDADIALRAYYGLPDSLWRSAALEARLRRGALEIQAEFQNHFSHYARNNMAYLQAAWTGCQVEPVGRFDLILPHGKRSEWMMTLGINSKSLVDHLKIMIDGSYHKDYQGNWAVFGFGLRLQAVL